MKNDFVVTPWRVEGSVDYQALLREFGVSEIDDGLRKRLEKNAGSSHYMLDRRVFFAHRDLNWVLDEFEEGNKFFLYTGRGPSGHTHLGHLLPWVFTKYLQDVFGARLYFQLTDDEKFLFKEDLSLSESHGFAYENALDFIALGFDSRKTMVFSDLDVIKELYPVSLKVAKKITFSTAKAVFGFGNETNIGSIFFTAVQSVPAFLESIKQGRSVPCLIPHAVDQDPHFRVARDVAPKLGFPKPASIQCKFLPSLKGGGKMSASEEDSTIYTTDAPEVAEKKVLRAFTGGRATVEEQRRLGGNPDVCSVCQYLLFFFEKDDKKLAQRFADYRAGKILDGENKAYLAEKVKEFLKEHQRKREQARRVLDKFLVKDFGIDEKKLFS